VVSPLQQKGRGLSRSKLGKKGEAMHKAPHFPQAITCMQPTNPVNNFSPLRLPARLVLPRSLSILWCDGSTPHEQKDHVTGYMQQTCSRDNSSCSSFQENSCLLCTQKFHKRVKNGPPLDLILSQISPVLTISSYILKAYFSIILPSTPRHYMHSLTPFNFI
jgi:hypothetical protein